MTPPRIRASRVALWPLLGGGSRLSQGSPPEEAGAASCGTAKTAAFHVRRSPQSGCAPGPAAPPLPGAAAPPPPPPPVQASGASSQSKARSSELSGDWIAAQAAVRPDERAGTGTPAPADPLALIAAWTLVFRADYHLPEHLLIVAASSSTAT